MTWHVWVSLSEFGQGWCVDLAAFLGGIEIGERQRAPPSIS